MALDRGIVPRPPRSSAERQSPSPSRSCTHLESHALARAATLLVAWVALKLARAFGDATGFALGCDSQDANLGEPYVLDAAAG